ncbi:MAG: GDSL-type esterase/lipase family protein [Actinomycetota bacterium]|nr:GDSL-type esterase/lipase family protein [Actinomycetota bacterium]
MAVRRAPMAVQRPPRLALLRCVLAQVGFLAVGAPYRRFRGGAAASSAQVEPYALAWQEAGRIAEQADGPLWAVLGDSAAQGIGADAYDAGYVGQLRRRIEERSDHPWRLANLSRSGARAADVVATQLPALAALPVTPQLVTCAIGGNDLLRTPLRRLIPTFRAIIGGLPAGAVLATLPQGLASWRARRVNAVIRAEAPPAGLRVADLWAHTGPPWQGKYANDLFHPNAVGYADWAAAFAEVLELEVWCPG